MSAVVNLRELPNYIAGEWQRSDAFRDRIDESGCHVARIYSASTGDLRTIKRRLREASGPLASTPIDLICDLLELLPQYYLTREADRLLLRQLLPRSSADIEEGVRAASSYCANIRAVANRIVGDRPLTHHTRRVASPASPAIGILPKNSDIEALWLIVHALVARVPLLIRTSQGGPTIAGATFALDALTQAASKLGDARLDVALTSIGAVNLFETDRSAIIDALAIRGATWIVFGSNETITKIEPQIRGHTPRRIVPMGTGFASTIVFPDAPWSSMIDEVAASIVYGAGEECVSTRIAYVHESVCDEFADDLRACRSADGHHAIDVTLLKPADSWPEQPGRIVGVRSWQREQDFLELMHRDLAANGMARAIAVSCFGSRKSFQRVASSLPAWLCRLNRGTHRVRLDEPHQGIDLAAELVDWVLVDEGTDDQE